MDVRSVKGKKTAFSVLAMAGMVSLAICALGVATLAGQIGAEIAVPHHLMDGEESRLPLEGLLEHGRVLFTAMWTAQEGGGRPMTKGTGAQLSDLTDPLVFPRNFNRLSGPDSNACSGCHNLPRTGGAGEMVTSVFVTGERFDSVTFDHEITPDTTPTKSAYDEDGYHVNLTTFSNFRNPPGLFGSGFIELLARQMTADLREIRDGIPAGGSAVLTTKGVFFGTLTRNPDGTWNTASVEGLAPASLAGNPPGLEIRPFHQSGAAVSLRQFTGNAFNQHHGIQVTQVFGTGTDPDQDGFRNEMTRADLTAAVMWQAALPVPGRVIPNRRQIENAVLEGETLFADIGCAGCHIPALPLEDGGWIFSEPNPFNPPGFSDGVSPASVDLTLSDGRLPGPRLTPSNGVVLVPAFTDLKLHDITSGPDDPNREPLNMNALNQDDFFAGNGTFITRKLWGIASERPFYHHGKYTTMREAVLAHAGEALASRNAFASLNLNDQNRVIEFLKTLQVLPPGTSSLVVDEEFNAKEWPPRSSR